jgi:hypothetical protein
MMVSAAHVRQAFRTLTIVFVALVGFIWFNSANQSGVRGDPDLSTGVKNLVVTIGDRTFSMSNGFAAHQAVPRLSYARHGPSDWRARLG